MYAKKDPVENTNGVRKIRSTIDISPGGATIKPQRGLGKHNRKRRQQRAMWRRLHLLWDLLVWTKKLDRKFWVRFLGCNQPTKERGPPDTCQSKPNLAKDKKFLLCCLFGSAALYVKNTSNPFDSICMRTFGLVDESLAMKILVWPCHVHPNERGHVLHSRPAF